MWKVAMKSSSIHFTGKQPGVEDKKGSCIEPQSTPVGSDGVEGFASSAAAASAPVLGSGMWDPWCTHPPACPEDSWLEMLLDMLTVSPNALSRHIEVFIPVFSQTPSATPECVS